MSSLVVRGARRLARRLIDGKPIEGRELQLRTETLLIYSLAKGAKPSSDNLPDELSRYASLISEWSPDVPVFEEQANYVSRYLLSTVLSALRKVKKDADSGSMQVRESTISDAGLGLFVGNNNSKGLVSAGSLLALYPGVIYLPSDLKHLPHYPDITKHNEYLIWRYDGIVIDGKAALPCITDDPEPTVATDTTTITTEDASQELLLHPYAQAHRANHPPPGKLPNCIPFMVNIPTTREFAPLRSLIPNAMYPGSKPSMLDRLLNRGIRERVPSTKQLNQCTANTTSLPCLALIATRDLYCDEEIFMNYRYNPAAPAIPDWYHDCDPQSTQRRWAAAGRLLI